MDDLKDFTSPATVVGRVFHHRTVTVSTNDDARALAATGAPHGTLVVADAQTGGRGRRGRVWYSPPGNNLYASFVLRPEVPLAEAPSLSLVAGLAVAEAVAEHAPHAEVRVKWPNDVRVGGKKLAGVLLEASLRGGELAWVVLGVGINVRGTRPPEGLEDIATTVRCVHGEDVSRRAVLASLCLRLEQRLLDFEHGGFAALRDALTARCETLGTPVRIGTVEGLAMAIDLDGALRVRQHDGGWVSLRLGDVG
jgi:BirA family biotin operon repressor/biotin-[acetyl-CoA-carboxylase] ligase